MNILQLFDNRPFIRAVILHFIFFMIVYGIIQIGYCILYRAKNKKIELRQIIGMMYLTFVLALTMTPLEINFNWEEWRERIQLVPFDTVTRYWPLDGEYSTYNLVGNTLLMIPMIPILTNAFGIYSLKRAFGFTLFFVMIIEVLQLFATRTRAMDIDDVILNMGGFIVSFLIWIILKKIKISR